MSMNSRAITQRQIARQDTAPQDTALLWLDTSFDPAVLKTYNGTTEAWEPVASSVVSKQDTAPQSPADGDMWQDTSVSPAVLKQYDSASSSWVGAAKFPDLQDSDNIRSWQKITNVETETSDTTITLSETWEDIMLDFRPLNVPPHDTAIELQVNGVTSYNYVKNDGTTKTDGTTITLCYDNYLETTETKFPGRFNGTWSFLNSPSYPDTAPPVAGEGPGVTSPITDIRLFRYNGDTFAVNVDIWGRK